MRKTADEAAAETERQRRIRRGRAVQAARRAALEIARGAQDAERQAENGEQAEQARLRRLAAQEKLHEERRLARESEDARRRHRQVESEAQAAAQLALTSSTVSAAQAHAAARIDELGNAVQAVVAQRREQRARRTEEIARHKAWREGEHERQVADIGANGRRAAANVEAARAEARRRRHALAEARRARQDAATAIRREQDAKLERQQRAVDLQGREEDAEWVRRWESRGFHMVSRELGGRRSTSSAPPGAPPNLTPRPPPDQPTPREARIEERAARERDRLLRMDERLKAIEAQVCTHRARTALAPRTGEIKLQAYRRVCRVQWSLRTSTSALHPRPPCPPSTPPRYSEAAQRGPAGAARDGGGADARGLPQDARQRVGGHERPAHRHRRVRRAQGHDADPRLRPHHGGGAAPVHVCTSAPPTPRPPPPNSAPAPPRPATCLA